MQSPSFYRKKKHNYFCSVRLKSYKITDEDTCWLINRCHYPGREIRLIPWICLNQYCEVCQEKSVCSVSLVRVTPHKREEFLQLSHSYLFVQLPPLYFRHFKPTPLSEPLLSTIRFIAERPNPASAHPCLFSQAPCVIVIYAFCTETDLEPSKDRGPTKIK